MNDIPNFTYPPEEKLKKKKTIDLLFSEGQTVTKYPLRLVFVETSKDEPSLQMGVSVSKRYFKKAVDRNYYKRVLREAYRLHKTLLTKDLQNHYACMFFYQTKAHLDFKEIIEKTQSLFLKFNEKAQQLESKTEQH